MANKEVVRVEGLRELSRAFSRYDKELKRELRLELKAAAEIVAVAARQKLSELAPPASPATVSGIRGRTSGPTALVDQRLRKSTGNRGDWGATQMAFGLIPARSEKYPEVVQATELMLDRLGRRAGF